MTHEFKHIIEAFKKAQNLKLRGVLASVVALNGSSYRRPGVRMLLLENGSSYGAVSGGCVEKEVFRQAQEVFETGVPKMMTYDGRFRLGCEGILTILLEPFQPSDEFYAEFEIVLKNRSLFGLRSYFREAEGAFRGMGTDFVNVKNQVFSLGLNDRNSALRSYEQFLEPCQRLLIFGGEHDAVVLSGIAGSVGWDVEVFLAAEEQKQPDFFAPAQVHQVIPELLNLGKLDQQTAVLLMTHSYSKDLKYLIQLVDSHPAYFGILGPARRRERLINDLLHYVPEVEEEFIANLFGPSGLDIGAEGPQEIAISILAEILAVMRKSNPISLRDKSGSIHGL
jgi:xanthine/CO dehydrogenase XdhC/CoxF family maturation factor